MPFEYAVRPFESRDSHGRIVIPSTPGTTRERATLTWGAKIDGSLPSPQRQGVNVECCNDGRTQTSNTMDPVSVVAEGPGQSAGQTIQFRRASVVKLNVKHEDNCAAEWDQMSGVASAIEGAFTSLKADIEAGGAGKTVDHCKAEMRYTHDAV